MDDHKELAEAAASGIRIYLRSSRGASHFGAGASVEVTEKNEVLVSHKGNVTYFTPLTI